MNESEQTQSEAKDGAAVSSTPLLDPVSGVSCEMPKYKCHKEVWALQIAKVELDSDKAKKENRETDGSAIITPADMVYAPIRVNHDYVRKHNPQPYGYYVVYADGYKSYSPQKAFEEGYARV